jgi:hypothetical protein
MKKRKVDDGVFVGERMVPETYEERMAAITAMGEAQIAEHLTWLDDTRREADSMLAYIREHDRPKEDIWRVEELQRELANFHLAGTPEYAAFRIGMILQDARVRIESPYLREGRAIAQGRENSKDSRKIDPERDEDMYAEYMSFREDNPHIKSKVRCYKAVSKLWYGDETAYKTIERAVEREEKRRDEHGDEFEN